jgi:hypothetical protein
VEVGNLALITDPPKKRVKKTLTGSSSSLAHFKSEFLTSPVLVDTAELPLVLCLHDRVANVYYDMKMKDERSRDDFVDKFRRLEVAK